MVITNYLTEYDRWMKSAKTTLRSATNDKSSEFYNWACFKAQHAVEYAVMAYSRGIVKCYYGHSGIYANTFSSNAEFSL